MKRFYLLLFSVLLAVFCAFSCKKAPSMATLTFDANGGKFADGTSSVVVTGEVGSPLTKPGDPSWDDAHTFEAWEPAIPATFPDGNVTYKAKWSEVKVSVIFDANGGKFSDGAATLTLEGLLGAPLTSPEDPVWDDYHIFKGWDPAPSSVFPAQTTTYKAQWDVIMGKVTFDARGGKFADGSASVVLEGIPGSAVEFPQNPVWSGNEFVCWDNKGSDIVFPAKGEDLNIGAIWNSMDIEISTEFGSASFRVVRIPAGTYKVGSPESEPAHLDDEYQHDVTFTKDFYIGTTEFTQEAWKAVTGQNPSLKSMAWDESAANNPVNCVGWQDICGENGDYGEDSFVFKLRQAVKQTMGLDLEFRLPTEAEWETAARGGQKESLPFGIGTGRCLYWYMANFGCSDSAYDMDKSEEWDGYVYDEEGEENCLNAYTFGGYYSDYANGYGCYDFHGNLAEWCWDWYNMDYYYTPESQLDPQGPQEGNDKVLRGGWCMPFSSGGMSSGGLAAECRSACRGMYPLKDSKKERAKGGAIGFRICVTGFNK